MPRLSVRHRTLYRYRNPVSFGDHHFHLRPRESFDQRLRFFQLTIEPTPRIVHFRHDPMGNAVGVARFDAVSDQLLFDVRIEVEQQTTGLSDLAQLDASSRRFPPRYPPSELPDLAPFLADAWTAPSRARRAARLAEDTDPLVARWLNALINELSPVDAVAFLAGLCHTIYERFDYNRREERGIQRPAETLELERGTCRDFAVLMMACARAAGFAARFVSGYIGSRSAGTNRPVGGGATHAWCQVYLPDGGWIDFDPTNSIIGNDSLIRVACVRDATQGSPLSGTYSGPPGSSLEMEVEVIVRRVPEPSAPAPSPAQTAPDATPPPEGPPTCACA